MKSIILAGGKGTRLRPITYLNPKPMLPLVNRPFMENFILRLKSHGLKDIIFSTGYLPDIFREYFGDGSGMGMKLTYVSEEKPLGTCGAVKNVEKHLDNDPFMVFNGDILTSLDLKDMISFHKKKKADITISLVPVDDPTAYGLVPIDRNKKVKAFLEKPNWEEIDTNLINAGTYIIERHILDMVPRGENYSFERDLFPKALHNEYRIFGYESDSYWLDVGTPQKYLAAHHDILNNKISFKYPYPKWSNNIYVGKNVKCCRGNFTSGPVVIGDDTVLDRTARVLPQTVIGSGCRLEKECSVSGSVIFDGCLLGESSVIKDSIISKNVKIAKDVKISQLSVVGDNAIIGEGNILKNGIKVNINSILKDKGITF